MVEEQEISMKMGEQQMKDVSMLLDQCMNMENKRLRQI